MEWFREEAAAELVRAFFTEPVGLSAIRRDMVEVLLLRGVRLLVDGVPEWSLIESRIRSNLRFFVSMAYILIDSEVSELTRKSGLRLWFNQN